MKNSEFNKYIGPYIAINLDIGCNEPVMWGYELIKTLGPELWDKLKSQYKVIRNNNSCLNGKWFVVTKTLTRTEAIEKYGPVSKEIYGTRGGFKSGYFGSKLFRSSFLGCPKAFKELKSKGSSV